ncbi:MAG: hypothetical protein HFE35_04040 [Clostridia bacterium]|jgi:hypothetical protein|uniref:stage III sporulation protein AF n=1 Tax=Pumilibacter muris TaxID=2941510 RepID=UPI00203F86BF|nr:stage III sporulation protein AF [Pumilibacter muris]MCI8595974.1 hypothetical protein [Clostridia bacterium]
MKALGGWVLSILGIVVIGAVIDLVLPSGRMNKYIKSVFAAVTVLIVILPLPSLVKNGCSPDGFLLGENVQLQDKYISYTEELKKKSLIGGLKSALESDGIKLGDIEIDGDFSAAAPEIKSVRINLSQVVIVGQSEHINKYELLRNKVSLYLAVDKDVIAIYEN